MLQGDGTIVSSVKGVNGAPVNTDQLNSSSQFSDSLEKAHKDQKATTIATESVSRSPDNVALSGRVVYGLAAGSYGESDIASGRFAKDVESITGEAVDTDGLPESAARVKVANAFIRYLKDSG